MRYPLIWSLVFALLGACNNRPNSNAASDAVSGKENTGAVPQTAVRKNIIFFGNSLTAAYQLSPEQGFTALLQHKIDSLQLPYRCVNAGLSGETTADGVNRVDWVLDQGAAVFVLELGGNDALRGLPVTNSKQNLQTIIDKVKAKYPDCKIIVAGMLAPPNLGTAYTHAFRDMYPALAKTNKAALIPFLLEGVAADPALNLEDGIHPNPAGHKIVAETIWKVLRKELGVEG